MVLGDIHPANRFHPGHPGGGSSGGDGGHAGVNPADIPVGGRLNLLLTAPAWRSETWADRLPSLLDPMGIRSVRAQTAKQAEHLIRRTTVHIAVVDLTLPLDEGQAQSVEEGGVRILDLLARMDAPPPTVVVQAPRGHRDATRCMSAALRCGAFAVVDRSAADIELMLDVMRRMLEKFYASRWPGAQGGAAPAHPVQPPPSHHPRPRRLYDDPRRGPGMA